MSIKNEKKIIDLLEDYTKKQKNLWTFGNKILYNMCSENPLHKDKTVVAGKVWLIGRSYAASLERVKEDIGSEKVYEDFLCEVKKRATEIDKNIQQINLISISDISNNLTLIFNTHKIFTEIFESSTKLHKRSLASKYLHFHCPNAFFIYDSRAKNAINSLVRKVGIGEYKGDDEYVDFYLRVLELQKYILQKIGKWFTPRELDNFLLFNKGDF